MRKSMRITVTTPSLGVQQWHEDGSRAEMKIAWATEGGRGVPRRVIMLPVVADRARDGGEPRWVVPAELMRSLTENPTKFWERHAARRLRQDIDDKTMCMDFNVDFDDGDGIDPGTPRAITLPANPAVTVPDDAGLTVPVDPAAWWGAHHLVVLLVYEGLVEIGGPGDTVDGGVHDRDPDRAEAHAIARLFGEKYESRLVTRGLVRLPSAPGPERRDNGGEPRLVFAVASCLYPSGMTDGAPKDHQGAAAPTSASLKRLSETLLSPELECPPGAPSLLLLVGDQVYLDATAGLFDARSADDRVRVPYQNLMGNPGAQAVFGLLPVAMTLDDHEIEDNWEPGTSVPDPDDGKPTTDPEKTRKFFRATTNAYRRFQRMAGPPLGEGLWSTFVHAGVPFFLADTRTERFVPWFLEPRRVDNWHRARIMGPEQWTALQAFLRTNRDRVSFVASPAMLLPRTLGLDREPSLALSCDGWDGFPASMHALLALLCEYQMDRVVFLSGDAHVSMIVKGTVEREGKKARFWSIHSSGLYSPYPFANGVIEDYAIRETFSFTTEIPGGGGQGKYTCKVTPFEYKPGHGFATIALTNAGGHDELRVCFDRTDGPKVCDTIELPRAPGAATVPWRPSAGPARR